MPAGQAEHWASDDTVHAVETNCPGHVLHAEHDAALVVSEKLVPAPHDGHTVSAVEEHTALRNLPAAHTVHVDANEEFTRQ